MAPAAVEFEEFLSRSVSQLVTSVGWPPRPTLGLTQRPGKRQSRPLCVTTSRAGPEPAQSIIGPNGVAFPPPRSRLAPDGAAMADLPEVIGLLYRADWTRLSLSAELRSENDRELSRLSSECVVPLGPRLAGAEAGRRPLRGAWSTADRSRRALAPGVPRFPAGAPRERPPRATTASAAGRGGPRARASPRRSRSRWTAPIRRCTSCSARPACSAGTPWKSWVR